MESQIIKGSYRCFCMFMPNNYYAKSFTVLLTISKVSPLHSPKKKHLRPYFVIIDLLITISVFYYFDSVFHINNMYTVSYNYDLMLLTFFPQGSQWFPFL